MFSVKNAFRYSGALQGFEKASTRRTQVASSCDLLEARGANLWIGSDNVRKGVVGNAAWSGELLIKHYL